VNGTNGTQYCGFLVCHFQPLNTLSFKDFELKLPNIMKPAKEKPRIIYDENYYKIQAALENPNFGK
jgi:hypothetical protein